MDMKIKKLISKNRKVFFAFLFLLASLFIKSNVYALDIKVDDVKIKDKSSSIDTDLLNFNDNEVETNIVLDNLNDFINYEIELINNDKEKYILDGITDNNTSEYIKIEYESLNKEILPQSKFSIKVKIKYDKKLINVEELVFNNIKVILNLTKEDGTSEEVIINNPITGDNIPGYLFLLIITITALIFSKKVFNNKALKVLVLIIPVIMLPLVIFASESYKVEILFKNLTIKGEMLPYEIRFNSDGGNEIASIIKRYGEIIDFLPVAKKDGYTFEKWVDEDNEKIKVGDIVTKEMSLTAIYKIITYNITYTLNGGEVTGNPDKYTIESNDITLKNPRKTGYTFTGWTGTGLNEKTTSVTIESGSTGDKEYIANYSANEDTEYKVTHKYEKLNGDYEEEIVTEYGKTGSEVEAPIKSKTGFVNPEVQRVTIKADGSSEITYTYAREEYAFSISDRTYIDSTSTADGNYPYETEINAKAKERAGYDFVWSDGETNYERTFEIKEATTLTPIYTARSDTAYKVVHKQMNIDGETYSVKDTDNLTGITDSIVTPEVNIYEGFISPETKELLIKGDGTSVLEYLYERNKYQLTIEDPEFVEEDKSGKYFNGEEVTIKAKEREGYTFIGWSTGETEEEITIRIINDVIIRPMYEVNNNPVCKRSSKLYTEECNYGSSCTTLGYGNYYSYLDWKNYEKSSSTIVYGSLGTDSSTLNIGDSFVCDVNGDGEYNEDTEIFYYVSDYYNPNTKSFDSNYATLIYFNGYNSGPSNQAVSKYISSEEGYGQTTQYGPVTASKILPTTSEWGNISLINNNRQILNEKNETKGYRYFNQEEVHDLEVFDYSGRTARLLTYQEVANSCGIGKEIVGHQSGEYPFSDCLFLATNTKGFASNDPGSEYISLETAVELGQYYVWGIDGKFLELNMTQTNVYGDQLIKPAIELQKNELDLTVRSNMITFVYNAYSSDNPTGSDSIQFIPIGESIGALPVPVKQYFTFDGWYTEREGGSKITESTIPTGNTSYYAHWTPILTFSKGSIVNNYMKTLAGSLSNIKHIKRSNSITSETTIKVNESITIDCEGIVMWFEDDTIYYYAPIQKLYLNEDSGSLFSGLTSLIDIDFTGIDTSRVKNMAYMFSNCSSLTELDLSSFDTSNVIVMAEMFSNCSSLEELDLSSFNTSNVTSMYNMFSGCTNLLNLNVKYFKLPSDSSSIFSGLSNLITIDLSNVDTTSVVYMSSLFANCSSLTKLDLSSFDTSNVVNTMNMFLNNENLETIYVSDKFVISDDCYSNGMFRINQGVLTGENGTAINDIMSSDPDNFHTGKYAHVDGGVNDQGYFTYKEYNVSGSISKFISNIYNSKSGKVVLLLLVIVICILSTLYILKKRKKKIYVEK